MKTVTVEIYEKGTDYRKGKMYIDGRVAMLTLERRDAELRNDMTVNSIILEKENGICAIPYGCYKLTQHFSAKFKKYVPLLLNVPGFEMIEIHVGNSSADSEGCILVGMTDKSQENWIGYSLTATRILQDIILNMEDKDLWLLIKDGTIQV
jgi:hypothetical protein